MRALKYVDFCSFMSNVHHETLGMYIVLISYGVRRLSLPFGSLIVLTQSTQPPAHTCGGMVAGSNQRHLSDKIVILY
jgi:hypothetical protein